MFCITLVVAAYLGFGQVHIKHDKAVHFLTFFTLTVELWFLWDRLSLRFIAYLVMLLIAVVLEFVQNTVNPSRIFDVQDIYANIAGLIMAFVGCMLLQQLKRKDRRKRRTAIELEMQPPTRAITPGSEDEIDGFVNVRSPEMV